MRKHQPGLGLVYVKVGRAISLVFPWLVPWSCHSHIAWHISPCTLFKCRDDGIDASAAIENIVNNQQRVSIIELSNQVTKPMDSYGALCFINARVVRRPNGYVVSGYPGILKQFLYRNTHGRAPPPHCHDKIRGKSILEYLLSQQERIPQQRFCSQVNFVVLGHFLLSIKEFSIRGKCILPVKLKSSIAGMTQ